MAHAFSLRDIPKTTVLIVAGPTASGKSDWAMNGAEQDPPLPNSMGTGGRIINGDSMQMYQGLDILTAMPSAQDQGRIHHDVYGVLPAYGERYCVSQWMKRVHQSIKQAHDWGQRAWIVGGTGFYLNTLINGLSPMPDCDPEEKARLRAQYQDSTVHELKALLSPIDPNAAEKLVDHQRLLNAWMVYQLTGKSLTWWHSQARVPSSLTFLRILIWPSKDEILHRAEHRLNAMIQQGAYEEVRTFCSHPAWAKSPLHQAIGLIPIYNMLQGKSSEEECRQRYLTDISQYIKRQRTWFRQQFCPHYIDDGAHGSIIPL